MPKWIHFALICVLGAPLITNASAEFTDQNRLGGTLERRGLRSDQTVSAHCVNRFCEEVQFVHRVDGEVAGVSRAFRVVYFTPENLKQWIRREHSRLPGKTFAIPFTRTAVLKLPTSALPVTVPAGIILDATTLPFWGIPFGIHKLVRKRRLSRVLGNMRHLLDWERHGDSDTIRRFDFDFVAEKLVYWQPEEGDAI